MSMSAGARTFVKDVSAGPNLNSSDVRHGLIAASASGAKGDGPHGLPASAPPILS